MPDARPISPSGLAYVLGVYAIWGLFPLYFAGLTAFDPVEIVGWRLLLTFAFSVVVVAVTRSWGRVLVVMRDRGSMLMLGIAGALIFVNWLLYVVAVTSGHVLETSLGYFINPIITVLLGIVLMGERATRLQWVSVAIAAVAVVVLVVGHGSMPWLALTLAVTFALYSYLKRRLGPRVDATTGLVFESFWLIPVAVLMLVLVGVGDGLRIGQVGVGPAVLLLCSGIVTAVPLMLFAAAARRVTLIVLGLAQYIAPLMIFVLGITVFAEQMPPARWIGFALVWCALAVLAVDMVRRSRRNSDPAPG